MGTFNTGYEELVEIILLSNHKVDKCVENIKIKYPGISETVMEKIHHELMKNFLPNFSRRWKIASRNKYTFFTKNKEWLKGIFSITLDPTDAVGDNKSGPSQRFRSGRPEKSFDDCCDRAKQYKIKHLCENYSEELIVMAGHTIEKPLVPKAFTPEKALALVLDASLSKYQYEVLRKASQEIGCDIFPSYYKLLNTKKECYPSDVDVTESCASVNLQTLLNHTISRILKNKTEELENIGSDTMTLVSKWGCDGSSGHSEYKQGFDKENVTDANMFLTSLVPLQLHERENDSLVLWKNTRPSSTRFCRPVKFQFASETPENTKSEVARMETEIKNLTDSVVKINGKIYKVNHKLLFTMIDGKIAQTVTDTSSMAVCFICKAKPSEKKKLKLQMPLTWVYRRCMHESNLWNAFSILLTTSHLKDGGQTNRRKYKKMK